VIKFIKKKKKMSETSTNEMKLIFTNDFKQDSYKILEITKELADELEKKEKETK